MSVALPKGDEHLADLREYESEELGFTITIDYDLCKGHGKCIEECPTDPVVYELVEGKATAPNIDEYQPTFSVC